MKCFAINTNIGVIVMIKYIVSLALLGFILGFIKGYLSDTDSSQMKILYWILYIIFIIIAIKFGWHVLVILHRNW